MEYQEILHRCFRCGYCKFPSDYADINCPAYLAFRFETFAPGGRMWLLSAWLDGKIGVSQRLGRIMFSCTGCGNCVTHCAMPGFRDQLLLAFTAGRDAILETGTVPGPVRDYLTKVQNSGNPYGKSGSKRADWRTGVDVDAYNGQEYLFFAGDVGSYDPRGQEIASAPFPLFAFALARVGGRNSEFRIPHSPGQRHRLHLDLNSEGKGSDLDCRARRRVAHCRT